MNTLFHRTIAQSESVSSIFAIQNADSIGLFASIPTSCVAYIQVSHNTTSANFMRACKTDVGSGDWSWGIGSGTRAIDLTNIVGAFTYMRLETSVAQAVVASLSVIVKF